MDDAGCAQVAAADQSIDGGRIQARQDVGQILGPVMDVRKHGQAQVQPLGLGGMGRLLGQPRAIAKYWYRPRGKRLSVKAIIDGCHGKGIILRIFSLFR
jgi:hypothetical protein